MVYKNMILRRIFGPKNYENGEWRRLHNDELYSLYGSPDVVRVIKSRTLSWTGHAARMEEGRRAFKILTRTPSGKRSLEGLSANGRIKLEWIIKKLVSI
jgi:hypothetical protein